MSRWMDEHGMNPSVAERKEICKLLQAAGNDHYTPKNVLHWFKNQRARGPRKASAPASSANHTTNRETTGSPTISSTGLSQPVDNGGDGPELAEKLSDFQISELRLLLEATPNPTDEIIAIWARLSGVEKGAIEAHMQSNRMDVDVDSDGLAEIEPVGGLPTPAASPTAEPLAPLSPCTLLAASEEYLPPTSISPLPGASIPPKALSNESDFNDPPPPPIPPAISAESVLKVETGLVLQALVDGVREAAASSAVHAPAPRSLEDFDQLWNTFCYGQGTRTQVSMHVDCRVVVPRRVRGYRRLRVPHKRYCL
ncbi:hypothetical protein CC2G_008630 [Coprinopsis cinerea AmutBmut pab1-1]|nr:hypothetical protein CC2G_008630 [Coprinopsis cinerea AmutBmut pab1-1]